MSCLVLLSISMILADHSEFMACDCITLTEKIYSLEKANIQLKKKVEELMGENKGIFYKWKYLSWFILSKIYIFTVLSYCVIIIYRDIQNGLW